ncbi:MAG TPA: hypothetical protein VIB38_12460 [Aestuariivirgaceae bacterium]
MKRAVEVAGLICALLLGSTHAAAQSETYAVSGAPILGIGVDEVVQAFLGVMTAAAPYTVISRAIHIRPTVAAYLPVLLGDLKPLTEGEEKLRRSA